MKAALRTIYGSFPLEIVAWVAASFARALAAGTVGHDQITELVSERSAVERVYYNHRLGAKLPFEQALPAAEVERLVKADLRKEALLAKVYHVGVTRLQVEADVKRIDLETRAPEMLAEIKAALGDDPARFARAVAKPIVVDRELRRRFANDDQLHGVQRRQAESAREELLAAQRKENPWTAVLKGIKQCTEWTVSDFTWQLGPESEEAQSPNPNTPVEARSSKYSLEATATFASTFSPAEPLNEQRRSKCGVGTARPQRAGAETNILGDGPSPPLPQWFDNFSRKLRIVLRAQLQKPGDVSAVIETPESFLLFVAKEKTEEALSAAALSVPKISFEQWLSEQKE